MSVKIMTQVFADTRLKSSQKLVMLALADYSGDEGVCFPSISTMVTKTSLSNKTIITSIRKLIDAGFLIKEYRSRRAGGRSSNLYLIYPAHYYSLLDEETRDRFLSHNSQSVDLHHEKTKTQSVDLPLANGSQSVDLPQEGEPSLRAEPSLTPKPPKPKKEKVNAKRMQEDWLNSEESGKCKQWAAKKWPSLSEQYINDRLENFWRYWSSTTIKRVGWYKTWQNQCDDEKRGIDATRSKGTTGTDYGAMYDRIAAG